MDPRLSIFYRQYIQQVDVDKLSWPPDNMLVDPFIQQELNKYFFTSHLMFPSEVTATESQLPMLSYRKRFAKRLTRRIEGAIHDPDQDVC